MAGRSFDPVAVFKRAEIAARNPELSDYILRMTLSGNDIASHKAMSPFCKIVQVLESDGLATRENRSGDFYGRATPTDDEDTRVILGWVSLITDENDGEGGA